LRWESDKILISASDHGADFKFYLGLDQLAIDMSHYVKRYDVKFVSI